MSARSESAAEHLVVQIPMSEATDFDSLIGIENGLIQFLKEHGLGEVEGHDVGEGKFNIVIAAAQPWPVVLGRVRAFLDFEGAIDGVLIARRADNGED
jgi:hypothetical protein